MKKRGQITIFIIIAIIIVGSVIFLFMVANIQEVKEPDEIRVDNLHPYTRNYIEGVAQKCLEKSQG